MNNILFYIAESVVDACFEIADYLANGLIKFWNESQLTILIVVGGTELLYLGGLIRHGGAVMM